MVLLEAAASGVPMVGTRNGGIPEVIIDGQTGSLAAERDSDELAARMAELFADDSRRTRMARQARTLVETQFDIHRQTEKLEDFYDGLVAGR